MKAYDFVFVSPLPPIISQPPGGINVFYRLSGYLASKGYKVAIVITNNKYTIPKRLIKEGDAKNLLSYPMIPEYASDLAIKATHIIFSNNDALRFYQKVVGIDYDYSVLRNVDILFADEEKNTDINTKRIFATAWQTAYFVEDYLKKNPDAKGFYLIQNFEDYKAFSGNGKYSKEARKTYDTFKNLRKIVVCKGLYDRFEKDKPLRITVGIDTDLFKAKTDQKDRDPCSILMPLRQDESKGSKYALETAKILRKESKNYKFIAYGNLKKEDVPDYIEYYYKPSNKCLSELYDKAAIFICPSVIEGFGIPPLEAMASGCAVITTDSVGVREYARDRINCLVVPVKDSVAMAKAIKRLVGDDSLKRKLVREGIKTAKEFSYKAMSESFAELFE